MLKVVEFLVEVGFWLRAFAAPMLVGGIASALVYNTNKGFSIFILVLGAIVGIVFAEYVRRKYGCSNYFSRLNSSPDNKTPKDKASNNTEKQ